MRAEVAEREDEIGRQLLLHIDAPGLIHTWTAKAALIPRNILPVQLAPVIVDGCARRWNAIIAWIGGDTGRGGRIQQVRGAKGVGVVVELSGQRVPGRNAGVDLLPFEDAGVQDVVASRNDGLVVEELRRPGKAQARFDVLVVDIDPARAQTVLTGKVQSAFGSCSEGTGIEHIWIELRADVMGFLEGQINVVAKAQGQVQIAVDLVLVLNVDGYVLFDILDGTQTVG